MSKSIDYRAIAEEFARRLVESGTIADRAKALEASISSVEVLRARFGGLEVYLPKGSSFISRTERNACLLRDWNGQNTVEVCARYGISRATLYAVAGRRK